MEPNTILINRYKIHRKLNQKPGRQTFLAEDLQYSTEGTDYNNLVVIKILQFNLDCNWDDLKLFKRETQTLQNLAHRSIPIYLNHFELDTGDIHGFALVQDYIDAPSLQSIIESGQKFSEREIIELGCELLTILTYLHEQVPSVIHRDIKPSNILIEKFSSRKIGRVYLVDFGSVQVTAIKDSGTRTIVGSYGYMPLEQFGGQTTVSSDLYSLGMTLIYLITGTHPAELSQENGRVKFDSKISKKLMKWLEKITQPYPDLRFNSARSAQNSLSSFDNNDSSVQSSFIEVQTKTRSKKQRSKGGDISIKLRNLFHVLVRSSSTLFELIEGILDVIVGLVVVLATLRVLWAILFEMKGIIHSSLITIAELLSIKDFGTFSGLTSLASSSHDGFTFLFMWFSCGLFFALITAIPTFVLYVLRLCVTVFLLFWRIQCFVEYS